MIKVSEVIIVEGRYDKNTLSQVVDAVIIETAGFGIFSDGEKLALIRRMADVKGIIVFTDSDGAGFLIRNYLKGSVGGGRIKHAYIPDVAGKEKRKSSPSKEGKLGVEGMGPQELIDALKRAGATMDDNEAEPGAARITKTDFFEAGLSGKTGSAERRRAFQKSLRLPEKLSSNALLDVLNAIMSRDEFLKLSNHRGDLAE